MSIKPVTINPKNTIQRSLLLLVIGIPLWTTAQHQAVDTADSILIKNFFEKSYQFMEESQLDSSQYYLEQIVLISESTEDWSSKNVALSELGYLYALNEDHKKSLDYFLLALNNAQKRTPTDTTFLEDQYYYVAYSYDLLGDYDQALVQLKASLDLSLSRAADLSIAETLIGIANIYMRKSDYENALIYQTQALNLYNNGGGKHPLEMASINNEIGLIWYYKQDYPKANNFFQLSLDLLKRSKKNSPAIAIKIHNNHALNLIKMKEFQLAQNSLTKARELSNKHKEKRLEKNLLFNQAFLNYSEGLYSKAYRGFQEVIKLLNHNYSDGHILSGKAHYYVALIHFEKKELDKAMHNCLKSLVNYLPEFQEINLDKIETIYCRSMRDAARSLALKAQIEFENIYKNPKHQIHETEQLFSSYDHAIQLIDQLRKQHMAEGSKHFLATENRMIYNSAIDNCYKLYRRTDNQSYIHKAFSYMEKAQAPILLNRKNLKETEKQGGVGQELLELENQLLINQAYYNNKYAEYNI